MKDVAHRLVHAETANNRGDWLAFGIGKEDLAAAYRKGGRGPECSVVRSYAMRGRTNKGICIAQGVLPAQKPLLYWYDIRTATCSWIWERSAMFAKASALEGARPDHFVRFVLERQNALCIRKDFKWLCNPITHNPNNIAAADH
jgi:hypothetical protein